MSDSRQQRASNSAGLDNRLHRQLRSNKDDWKQNRFFSNSFSFTPRSKLRRSIAVQLSSITYTHSTQ